MSHQQEYQPRVHLPGGNCEQHLYGWFNLRNKIGYSHYLSTIYLYFISIFIIIFRFRYLSVCFLTCHFMLKENKKNCGKKLM